MNLITDAGVDDGGLAQAQSSGLLGYVDGFDYKPELDAGVVDDIAGQIFPKEVSCGITFNVLHTHPLGWNSGVSGTEREGFNKFPYGNRRVTDKDVSVEYHKNDKVHAATVKSLFGAWGLLNE